MKHCKARQCIGIAVVMVTPVPVIMLLMLKLM